MKMHLYPSLLFSIFVRLLGSYMLVYGLLLIPHAALLYSNVGYLPTAELNNLPVWASIFSTFDTPVAVTVCMATYAFLGALLVLGIRQPFIPFMAWIFYCSFQNRNVLTSNPGTDLIGFLLIFLTIAFFSTWLLRIRRSATYALPQPLYEGAWFIMGLAFTTSGLRRLGGHAWSEGTGLREALAIIPSAEHWLAITAHHLISMIPAWLMHIVNFAVVGLFVFSLPLAMVPRARPYLLVAHYSIFGTLLLIGDIAQIIFAVLLFFLLLSDVLWPSEHVLSAIRRRIRGIILNWLSRHPSV